LTAAAGADRTHRCFDVVIDVVGGPRLPLFSDKLNPNGRLVSLGVVGGQPPADFAADGSGTDGHTEKTLAVCFHGPVRLRVRQAPTPG